MFSTGYGFVVDYLAEILRNLRSYDFSQKYIEHFELSSDISTRDRDGINKTFSGLMKILFPDGEASKEDIAFMLEIASEGRKRVKDQLMRIDTTYPSVSFGYVDRVSNESKNIKTLEEQQFPRYYYQRPGLIGEDSQEDIPVAKKELTEEEKLVGAGESDKLEFKSTLRWNLQNDRKDKIMEHAVLKTIVGFLNSEGGTLLIGVQDDGTILGIENDHFDNEDKFLLHFTNLLNDKVGKHYSDNVKWALKSVGEQKVLRVDCTPSTAPVYLKNKSAEEFYIRSGPSTVLLSTSELVAYIGKHFD